jgi:hypothetical protein
MLTMDNDAWWQDFSKARQEEDLARLESLIESPALKNAKGLHLFWRVPIQRVAVVLEGIRRDDPHLEMPASHNQRSGGFP